jgi:release factor glutamine methyltransferase
MHALKKSRTQLYCILNETISAADQQQCNELIKQRLKGKPIAYLIGAQSFWTMDLTVTEDTLIPRPETECLVEWILNHIPDHDHFLVADLGTGTGAIAIALALEKKSWQVDATDQSFEALAIAKKNAEKHGAKNISFYAGDWFDALQKKNYDVIVSNPPYIAENDVHLKQLQFEPQDALVSGKEGLNAIQKIVSQAKNFLKSGGYLVIEHGFDQAEKVIALFENAGLTDVKNHRDLSDVPRFVTGKA